MVSTTIYAGYDARRVCAKGELARNRFSSNSVGIQREGIGQLSSRPCSVRVQESLSLLRIRTGGPSKGSAVLEVLFSD